MNTDIQIFDFESTQVRVLTDEHGEPWFSLKDVMNILGIGNPTETVKNLDEDEFTTTELTDKLGRKQPSFIVSEPGLYKLIMRSRKPEAKKFQRWVTHEVLPTIRRHGMYATPATMDKMLEDPNFLIATLEKLKTTQAEKHALEAKIKADEPKIAFVNAITTSDRCITVGEMAKILRQNGYQTGQNRFFHTLRHEGYLMKKKGTPNMPTQKSMELALFEIKERAIPRPDGGSLLSLTPVVTPKGQIYFINRFCGRPLNYPGFSTKEVVGQ